MRSAKVLRRSRRNFGSTLTILAFSMLVLTAMIGVAIDLVAFYTVRSEAQRAADAAALAGATVFAASGCVGGASGASCAGMQATAAARATAIGNGNLVGGANPAISGAIGACPPTGSNDICFPTDASGTNPRISVMVQRSATHGNAMPTFFAKVFGIQTVDISAQASAEAFSPTGGSSTAPPICLTCIIPFIAVDCDTNRTVPKTDPNANPVCTVTGSTNNPYFFNPTTKAVVNPGTAPNGIIGETIILHGNMGPSDYGTTDLGQGNGASATADAISSCQAGKWGCGDTLELVPGKKTNQIADGVATRIHSTQCVAASSSSPQDNITVNAGSSPPFTITGGTGNPYGLSGQTITTSDSIVTVPVYDGTSTGNGSHTTFTIIGFLQLFLTEACHNKSDDPVTAVIMNVITCQSLTNGCSGTSGPPGSGFVSGGGANAIPVRLVQ